MRRNDNSHNYRDWSTPKLKETYRLAFHLVENVCDKKSWQWEHAYKITEAILKVRKVKIKKILVMR